MVAQGGRGGPRVCALLGRAYEHGLGVAPNPQQAAAEYHEAAMQGHAESQNALGYLFRRGLGVTQDYDKAVRWYQLATDQGLTQAANRLAWLLATCPQPSICDGRRALELARRAVAADRSNSNLDSLAAAHARLGDFQSAIGIINEIVARGGDGLRYRNRVAQYVQGKPFQL